MLVTLRRETVRRELLSWLGTRCIVLTPPWLGARPMRCVSGTPTTGSADAARRSPVKRLDSLEALLRTHAFHCVTLTDHIHADQHVNAKVPRSWLWLDR